MSLITTSLPTGPIYMSQGPQWCILPLYLDALSPPPYRYFECANSTLGTDPSDFLTICCDGDIKSSPIARFGFKGGDDEFPLDFANLICCRKGAGQLIAGGLLPIPEGIETTCYPGEIKTPLASLAATNTKNAVPYRVTYESASAGIADFTNTESPWCLWVQTTHPDVTGRMAPVVVEAAKITTLPQPSTHDGRWWGTNLESILDMERTKDTSTRTRTVLSESGGSKVTDSGQTSGPPGAEITLGPTGPPAAGASTSTKASAGRKACGMRLATLEVIALGLAFTIWIS
ncbi:hypothetical protein V8F20_008056 [Naviculisporaceae sp. PSN 640]